ncbi:carbohydrate kinase family protein [candidate division KSB1 bacterium]
MNQEAGLPAFFDVNLRKPWWNIFRIETYIKDSQWLKLNEKEYEAINPDRKDESTSIEDSLIDFAEKNNLNTIILTRGEDGALAVFDKNIVKSIEVENDIKVIDTVGAGDAFSAVCILGILHEWSIADILERAVEFASRICEVQGATNSDLSLYKNFKEKWNIVDDS